MSTSIQEEEEEDRVERPTPAVSQRAGPLQPACRTSPNPGQGQSKTSVEINGATAYPASKTAASVIAGVASATARLWGRLLLSGRRGQGGGQRGRCDAAATLTAPFTKPVLTVAATADSHAAPLTGQVTQRRPPTCQQLQSRAVTAPSFCPPALERPMPAGVLRPAQQRQQQQQRLKTRHHPPPPPPHQQQQQQGLVQCQPQPQPLPRQEKQPQQQRSQPPPSQHRGHLVRLVASDDVRLALHALKLAAQIHDHLWGPEGTAADAAGSREALLEAASPLYDMAMSAARAIQHRALHSLVKQAVRRYVNPCRGSPDDVLRVILKLLTGCGGKAAAAPAPPPPARVERPRAASCFSDAAIGHRSVNAAAASAASSLHAGNSVAGGSPRRGVSTEPPLERICGGGAICSSGAGGGPGAIDNSSSSSELGGGGSWSSCGGACSHTSSCSGSGSILGWDLSHALYGCRCSSNSSGGGGTGSCDSGCGRGCGRGCGSRPSLRFFGKHG